MSKPIKKPMFPWTAKAKKDSIEKFSREAQRLLNGGVSLDELKDACDRAVAADVTHT